MKLTYVQLEGTPEELAASDLGRKLLGRLGESPVPRGSEAVSEEWEGDAVAVWQSTGKVPAVADEGQSEVNRLLSRNAAAEYFVAFLGETSSWESVGVHGVKRKTARPGDPLDYTDYLRLRRQGSQLGGFAYIYALSGVINLRLNYGNAAAALEALAPAAYTLDTGHREYRVSIQITDTSTLQQALRLAKLAYERT